MLSPMTLLVAADDSILLPGSCTSGGINATAETCVTRLTPDGILDPSYGNSGIATLDGLSPTDAVILSDGSIVVGGSANDVAAYGILDANGKNSTITNFPATALGNTAGDVVQIALAPDDSVIGLFSATDLNTNGFTVNVAKITSAGEFDTTFGAGGYANWDLTNINIYTTDGLAVRPNGKIVVLADGPGNSGLVEDKAVRILQLDSSGALDTSFGIDGQTMVDLGQGLQWGHTSPVITPDGKIIATHNFAGLLAFKADGTDLDTTFGNNGRLSMARTYGSLPYVSLDNQNHLLVATCSPPALESVWRFTDDGAADISFGVNGQATTSSLADFTNGCSFAARVQKDGRIVVLTWTDQNILVVSRLWN